MTWAGVRMDLSISRRGLLQALALAPAAASLLPSRADAGPRIFRGQNCSNRNNADVAQSYDPLHASVLRLIALTVDNARRARKPISLCGELAGDSLLGQSRNRYVVRYSR